MRLASLLDALEVPHPSNEPRPTALVSHDTRPIDRARRVWDWSAYFSLWCTVAFCMANFQLGSSILALGLNWWQTIIATFFGHMLSCVLVVLMASPGLEYRISFPVSMRVAFGFSGSVFVVLNRIVTSIIFTGVQAWFGGQVTYVCLRALWPSIDHVHNGLPASTGTTTAEFVGFVVWYVLQVVLVFLSAENIRYLVIVAGTLGFVAQLVLVSWACGTMGASGFGSVITSGAGSAGTPLQGAALAWMFVYAMSVTGASITTGTVTVCDYTRFARTRVGTMWAQMLGGLPCWVANIFGVLTVAATQDRYGGGKPLWSLSQLLAAVQDAHPTSGTRCAVFFAAFSMAVLQLALNVAGNTFVGGTDMAALVPRWINNRRGQLLTAMGGLVINPWYLVSSATVFLAAMSSYAVVLQPFIGIMVAHYFVVQRRCIRVADLYKLGSQSIYWYTYGVNWRAIVAWAVGTFPHFPGFITTVQPLIAVSAGWNHLYYLDSYTGFIIAFAVTIVLHTAFPVAQQVAFVASTTRHEAMRVNEARIDAGVVADDVLEGVRAGQDSDGTVEAKTPVSVTEKEGDAIV